MNLKILIGVLAVMVQAVNDMNEKDYDWVSVSSLAVQLNVSKQTIYNRCARGEYPTKTFKRGSMVGLLVGTPKL
jgi:hypothetical protein